MYPESLLVLAILSWDILGCVASGHKPSISIEKVKLKCKTPGISNCHLFVCNDITQGSRHVQTCITNWTAAPQNSWKSISSHLQTLQELVDNKSKSHLQRLVFTIDYQSTKTGEHSFREDQETAVYKSNISTFVKWSELQNTDQRVLPFWNHQPGYIPFRAKTRWL